MAIQTQALAIMSTLENPGFLKRPKIDSLPLEPTPVSSLLPSISIVINNLVEGSASFDRHFELFYWSTLDPIDLIESRSLSY